MLYARRALKKQRLIKYNALLLLGIAMLVKDVMTKKVVSLNANDTVKEAVKKLAEHNISGAPVVDDNNSLVGIFSEADILRILRTNYSEMKMVYPSVHAFGIDFYESRQRKEIQKALDEIAALKISEVMTTRVYVAEPNDYVEDVGPVLIEKKINRLPVIENGKLVGIITRGDIIKAIYLNKDHKAPECVSDGKVEKEKDKPTKVKDKEDKKKKKEMSIEVA